MVKYGKIGTFELSALKTCDEDKAIDTYLTCAKKFFDNVDSEELQKLSKLSPKAKVSSRLVENGMRGEDLTTKPQTKIDPCTAVKAWLNCYYEDILKSNCTTDSELYKRSQALYQVMVDEFNCINSQSVAESETPDCQEKPMLNNFFVCAINYNVERKRIPVSLQTKPDVICPSNLKFEMCVAQAMRESRCLHERMKIMHHLKYLTDVITTPTVFCKDGADSFRMSFVQMKGQENCVRQRVLKKMFVCGLSFSNLFDEMEPRSERGNPVKCKLLIDYEQCIAKASRGTGCDEDAEMRVQIMSFSDIMRDEYKDSCPNVVYKSAPEAPEAFEDYEEDWAESDPYWYDTKDGAEGQASVKGRRSSAPVVKPREDPFGNSGPGQNASNDMDLITFLRRDPRSIYNATGKRRVHIEKEYLDDSPAAMASYGLGADYKEDYVDDSFARVPNRRMGLRYRAQHRRGDPNAWLSSRRAMKILDEEEQQEDDDIMGLMRRKRKRTGSDAVRRMSKDLQVKKQLDYDDEGEEDEILTDRETHISGDECNLKQLKRQSETCDRTFSDSIKVSWSKDWPAPASSSSSSTPAKDVQEKLCNSLVTYRTCLLETAKRMHCGEIASKVAVVVEEQMKKLGVAFCGASSLRIASWMALILSVALILRPTE
ncbi:hypothetical protein HPB50_023156 [Hyalomma asiaticum]|uniref:Uncharacterized protein n=1 Tax=Hyalomma asiaticum TaxID=266040 RepID=A0ACB7TPU5_HYAAI|nr:hypothetical protein HPB50_023156 [Hyalomma asiaticum]